MLVLVLNPNVSSPRGNNCVQQLGNENISLTVRSRRADYSVRASACIGECHNR